MKPMHLNAMVGNVVTLEGRAANAKRGPIIVLADATPVYLPGRAVWDDAQVGQAITARGTLRQLATEPAAAPQAGQSQRLSEGAYSLEQPVVQIVAPRP